jgi:D-alanyl-D-alanine carboxypeptidase
MAKKVTHRNYPLATARIAAIISIAFLFVLSPGQNYYQTLTLNPQPKLVRATNFDDFTPAKYPVKTSKETPPEITASAAGILDLDSGVYIYQKNLRQKLRPASLTKLVTALVAIDYYPLEQILTATPLVNTKGESQMGLKLGDQLSVENLLYGLLIPSGNDAAYVLASNYPGGTENFVAKMNLKAKSLSMFDTFFDNPIGTDSAMMQTSVWDMGLLAREILKNGLLKKITGTNWAVVPDANNLKKYPLQNVNQLLLNFPGTFGIKTGTTEQAGQCLISATRRQGQTIIAITLNSTDRFNETIKLSNWALNNTTPAVLH